MNSPVRILIIDDEAENLTMLTAILNRVPTVVETAETTEQGLELIATFQPTLILLDLAMPGIDGWELHQTIRKDSKYDHIPVVAVTALASQNDQIRAEQAGFEGYIAKPFHVQELLELIEQVLADHQGSPE